MFQLPPIGPLDDKAIQAATARQAILTKPAGSLGRLEELSIQIAGITGNALPSVDRKAVLVLAGDHGVCAEGVSPFPSEVTPQMVANFLRGGAAVNVLARQAGARVTVVDAGVACDMLPQAGLRIDKVAYGTRNMAVGPAMTREQAEQALMVGISAVNDEVDKGLDLIAVGEMGIGNSTAAAAITAAITGLKPSQVTGRGTGADDAGMVRKITAIERAIAVNQPNPQDGLDVLAKIGGLEIGAMAGVMLGAASHRVPVVIDGFICGSAALIAAAICPQVVPYLIPGHQSVEIGHQAVLQRLALKAVLDLDLRLGEGTGAVLAFHIIEAAVRTLREMATFAEAGVSEETSE